MAIDYGSPATVLDALQVILPVGTTIATVIQNKGIQALGVAFPVLILNAAKSTRRTVELQAKQMTCSVEGIYLDLWTSSLDRTLEDALADAQTALDRCAANVEANQRLTLNGVHTVLRAGGTIQTFVDTPLRDVGLGYPNITARISIDILGLIYTC